MGLNMDRLTGYNSFGGVYGIGMGCGDNTDIIHAIIKKLAEYEDLEEQGRLVILPCKIWDTVYRVMADKRIKQPYEYKVIGFWYSADETCNNLHLVRYVNGVFDSSISVPFSEFNRILFLTKEEAESVLNNA